MEMDDYRLLPKGLRRMLVFSETFFSRNAAKPRPRRKPGELRSRRPPPRRRFASSVHPGQPSNRRASAWWAISGMSTRQAKTWQSARTLGANECVPLGMWRKSAHLSLKQGTWQCASTWSVTSSGGQFAPEPFRQRTNTPPPEATRGVVVVCIL